MKLYARAGSFRAQKVLVAAEFSGKKVTVVDADEKKVKGKAAANRLPLLETDKGCLFESNAIMRFVADGNAGLSGKDAFEKAMIDSWVDFAANEVEVPATMWCYPIIGWMENYPDVTTRATKDLKDALTVLENHLNQETFLVGRSITLADIAVACALVLPMKLVLDDKTRKSYTCVTRWFTTCVNQPEFLKVVGPVTLVKKAVKCTAPAKSAGKKEKKEEKPKKEEPMEIPTEEKKKNPLDALPKSSFVLDAWKREYSNSRSDYYASLDWFWKNVDLEGYSLWKATYNYNDELKIGFQVSNLVGGFIQRCDAIRKYAFGCMQVVGQDGGPMEIVGCWLMRGQSEAPILEANPDAEYYTWTKYDPANLTDDIKKEVADLWCADETLFGKPIIDGKIFK